MTERQIIDAQLKVCRSFNAFGRLCLLKIGVFNVSTPKVPKWFEACFEAYWKTVWKKMPVGITDESITARDAGFYMGYIPWYKNWVQSCEANFEKLNIPKPKLSERGEKRVSEAWEKAVILDEIKSDWERFESGEADEDLALVEQRVAELPAQEASMFYEGKSKGLLGPSGLPDGSLEDTTATLTYVWLMMCWPWVIEFPNVGFLHQKLIRVLGKNRAGTLKRTEKLCQRIGLKFRGRGRPKKAWPFEPRKKHRRKQG